jgi:triosephosphate isomerase (TIM)
MPKVRYIIANWKMNMDLADITRWFDVFKKQNLTQNPNRKIILAPSAPYLGLLSELKTDANFSLAAQNVALKTKGAHTGEMGIFQIKNFCEFAIIGHSETGETFETARQKRDLCLQNGVIPIVCIADQTLLIKATAPGALVTWEDPSTISVDGKYQAHDPKQIQSDILNLRKSLPASEPLIYGGSVNRQNVEDLANINGLDGILVGNASTDPVHFAELISKF